MSDENLPTTAQEQDSVVPDIAPPAVPTAPTAAPIAAPIPADTTPSSALARRKNTMTGTVVSNNMAKTVVVQVTRQTLHPMYKKYVRQRTKYKAHDEHAMCAVGDQVVIEECRPLSKEKRWRVKSMIRKAVQA